MSIRLLLLQSQQHICISHWDISDPTKSCRSTIVSRKLLRFTQNTIAQKYLNFDLKSNNFWSRKFESNKIQVLKLLATTFQSRYGATTFNRFNLCRAVLLSFWGVLLRHLAEVSCWGVLLRCLAEVSCWGVLLRCLAELSSWGVLLSGIAEVSCWGVLLSCLAV